MAPSRNKNQAEAEFKKTQRIQDGKKAMSEYEAEAAAVRAKTERLRALRLARDAAAPPAAPVKTAAKTPAKTGAKAGGKTAAKTGAKKAKSALSKVSTTASASLSDWLQDRDDSGHMT